MGDTCVCCGEYVPEGRMVCYSCEKLSSYKNLNITPSRISKTDYYLGIAEAVSRRSTCLRRQYGSIIVKNDEIISTGYNGSPRGTDNCCDVGTCWRTDDI